MMFSKGLWKVQNAKAMSLLVGVLLMALGLGICTVVQASFTAKIVNRVFLLGNSMESVFPYFTVLVGAILLRGVFLWGEEHLSLQSASIVKGELLERMLEHSRRLGPAVMEHKQQGSIFTLLSQGLDTLDVYFCRYLPQLFKSALLPILYLFFSFPVDWISGGIFLLTTPLIPMFMMLIGKWSRKKANSSWAALSRMSAYLQDVLAGLSTLRRWNQEYRQEEKIRRVSEDFRLATMSTMRIAFLSALTLELLTTISVALVAVGLGIRLAEGAAVFEQALFLILLAPEYYQPLRQLGQQYHNSQDAISAADDMFAFLQREVTAQSPVNTGAEPVVPPEIALTNISFFWGDRPVLQDVTLMLQPGGLYALAGRSGAGKTTLLRLLSGALSPKTGTIQVDGQPFTGWHNLAYIPAHPHFFSGTVTQNITLGRDVPFSRVIAVCREIGIDTWIASLPQGYDTLLGQESIRLSGGQQQLISIARAMVSPCRIIFSDEATSSLDSASEDFVQKALRRLYQNKTVVVSAHRLHTLRDAKTIFVLEGGKIVQQGDFTTLSQDDTGAFASMLREGLAL